MSDLNALVQTLSNFSTEMDECFVPYLDGIEKCLKNLVQIESEKKKPNALFVHGFGGCSKSSMGACVKSGLEKKYNVIVPNFDLTDVDGTLHQIKDIIEKKDVALVCGTSLGGFYVMCAMSKFGWGKDVKWIAINPCMKPSEEIPALDDDKLVGPNTLHDWFVLESSVYDKPLPVQGIFADNDELFGDRFKKFYKEVAHKKFVPIDYKGGHHGGTKELAKILEGF